MKKLTYLAAIAAILIALLRPAQADGNKRVVTEADETATMPTGYTFAPEPVMQSNAEILAAYNEGVCDAFGLADACTDAQVLTAYCAGKPEPCVDDRKPDQKIYAAFPAFAAAVLAPERGKAIFEQRRNVAAAALNRVFLNANKAQCISILQAAGINRVAVCG